jgi:tetratricopeptide (TPR) repeat protein/ribosomal protein L40E
MEDSTVSETLTTSAPAETLKEGESAMFCTSCGTRNTADARFCKRCGHALDRTDAPTITEEEFTRPDVEEERFRSLLLLAFQKNEANDLDAAIAACEEALTLQPNSTDAHSLMSTLYEKKGDREKAITEREKVLQLNPGSIADREKLDSLRDGEAAVTPRKIHMSRRQPGGGLFDSPASVAFAAVAVTLMILLIGTGYALWLNSKSPTLSTTPPGLPTPPPYAITGTQQPGGGTVFTPQNPSQYPGQSAPSPAQQPPAGGGTTFTPGAAYGQPQNPPQYPTFDLAQGNRPVYDGGSQSRATPPAPVTPPTQDRSATPGNERRNSDGTTFILPDNQNSGQNPPSDGGTAQPPPSNPGRIRIDIAPDSGRTSAPGESTPGNANSGNSRTARAAAKEYHLQGNYQAAIREYIRALDGAGEDSAMIHQQIAICHQRLGDKESAITHYEKALAGFRDQIAAGRNVEAANQGIRVCEAGIRACR